LNDEEIEALARRLAQLMPGYLLLRDPPHVLVGSAESELGTGSSGELPEDSGTVIT
jgi:hypothetical protein